MCHSKTDYLYVFVSLGLKNNVTNLILEFYLQFARREIFNFASNQFISYQLMKTSLDHLPKEKQDLVRYIVNVITERIDPEKIILYGSYATGKWVEEEYYEEGRQM